MTADDHRIAIVIPTYNERANIKKLLIELKKLLPKASLFVVDDSSPDGTAQVVAETAQSYGGVNLIQRDKKEGLAPAYLDAFSRIISAKKQFDHIISMDADFSHHPEELHSLLSFIPDHDLVIGSRYVSGGRVENWSLWRRLISKYGNIYTKKVTQMPISDLTAGFVVYKREILISILQRIKKREAYAYQTEMKYLAHKLGANIKEVPITFRERVSGKSKLKKIAILQAIFFPWYLRFFR